MAELNENNEKSDDLNMENTKGGPGERVRKMKQKLEKMVLAMKQPDEDEIDEDIEIATPFIFKMKDEVKKEDTDEIQDIFAENNEKNQEYAEGIEKKAEVQEEISVSEAAGQEEDISEHKEQIELPPVRKKKDIPKITEIKPSSEEKKDKNLSQGSGFQMIYHSEEEDPFIVIAGKFTR